MRSTVPPIFSVAPGSTSASLSREPSRKVPLVESRSSTLKRAPAGVTERCLPELQGEAQYERMFIEEARLHARLTHQHLVQLHELGVADGQYFVRLDLVDGADLATLAAGAAMPEALALHIAESLALALDYVHR